MYDRYVVIDLETTGHSVEKGDRIIQIGAVVCSNDEIIKTFSTFVQPGLEIPPFIEELTGITEDDIQDAPSFRTVIPTILELLEDCCLVAHNADFDRSFLKKQIELEGYCFPNVPVIDTVELARIFLPQQNSYKLSELAEELGYSHDRPHQADSDASVTAALFQKIIKRCKKLPILTLQQLIPLIRKLKSDVEPILLECINQRKFTKRNETEYDCFRQLAIRKVEKQPASNNDTFKTYEDYMVSDYTELMKTALSQFERRVGQELMMQEVYESFNQNEYKLIEAGTGTGKSLAYLLPALFYAKQHNQPVIVSTQTIPLQEQLFQRDLPILKRLVPFPIHIALLKGRSHYLCLRKFEHSLSVEHSNYEINLTKCMILVWLTETTTGDIEEIMIPTGAKSLWYEIQSDASSDIGKANPWFSRCFYHRARRLAQEAQIVVTNHALLCTDLMHEQRILPQHTHVILDEAHHLEEVASNHLGQRTDYVAFAHIFQRLSTDQEHNWVEHLRAIFKRNELPFRSTERILTLLTNMKEDVDELFRILYSYIQKKNHLSATDVGRNRYRYFSFKEAGVQWQALLECSMRVHMVAKEIAIAFKQLIQPLENNDHEHLHYSDQSFITELEKWFEVLLKEEDTLYQLLLEFDPTVVYWAEIEPRGARNATYLYSKPLDVSVALADLFFAKKKSVILTSATLAVNGSFSYQIKRLGLEDFAPETCVIPSPFDYNQQARLLIPTDIPSIKEVTTDQFSYEIAKKLWQLSEKTKGKTLVLFTSYEMLRIVYDHIRKWNNDHLLHIIGQGVTSGSRAKLMKMFKQSDHAMLFGTSSFWEGIDLPGDELTTVVIVRLPFSPPDDPLIQAQFDQVKEEGGNPFMDISLPQAIIRFKQGFGRLIRSTSDRGAVFVFDRRITTTRYGKKFILSLPNVPVYEDEFNRLLHSHDSYL
ncbi:ATP-dependent DNA helicase DinG [Halalkalibacter sp. AB-rgal2]|uniref:ATP-dependent DNA helicase DinG n=1 Tax=Halalkalibacter sp. AB-rgal2 TaxID=3242695 RepID=UPI00359E54B5